MFCDPDRKINRRGGDPRGSNGKANGFADQRLAALDLELKTKLRGLSGKERLEALSNFVNDCFASSGSVLTWPQEKETALSLTNRSAWKKTFQLGFPLMMIPVNLSAISNKPESHTSVHRVPFSPHQDTGKACRPSCVRRLLSYLQEGLSRVRIRGPDRFTINNAGKHRKKLEDPIFTSFLVRTAQLSTQGEERIVAPIPPAFISLWVMHMDLSDPVQLMFVVKLLHKYVGAVGSSALEHIRLHQLKLLHCSISHSRRTLTNQKKASSKARYARMASPALSL